MTVPWRSSWCFALLFSGRAFDILELGNDALLAVINDTAHNDLLNGIIPGNGGIDDIVHRAVAQGKAKVEAKFQGSSSTPEGSSSTPGGSPSTPGGSSSTSTPEPQSSVPPIIPIPQVTSTAVPASKLMGFSSQASPTPPPTTELGIAVSCRDYLFLFSSFTFTPAGAIGRQGPTLANLTAFPAYQAQSWTQNPAYLNMTTQGVQIFTIPTTGTYNLTIAGARGGQYQPGLGAGKGSSGSIVGAGGGAGGTNGNGGLGGPSGFCAVPNACFVTTLGAGNGTFGLGGNGANGYEGSGGGGGGILVPAGEVGTQAVEAGKDTVTSMISKWPEPLIAIAAIAVLVEAGMPRGNGPVAPATCQPLIISIEHHSCLATMAR
ncbi:hypothetical protein WJX75_009876 [Coccomyxa subellipsoidea]|uniref:Uncharacterized protein n=1 Tax=Coccomyxa subellipsoidea TaxID=248742 RepID=A0ABR2YX18_9CHLO